MTSVDWIYILIGVGIGWNVDKLWKHVKLEKELEHYKNKANYLDSRELELLSEITSLEKSLHMIQRHYDMLETFSSSGNTAQDAGNTNETLPKGKE